MTAVNTIIERLRFRYWARWRANRYHGYNLSHSQFGEDMVIRAIFDGQSRGTYLDIGAFHPVFCSNTYHFYSRGWEGLNVEATPGAIDLFHVLRPRDVNVHACVSADSGEEVTLYRFDQPLLNTIDPEMAARYERTTSARCVGREVMRTVTLQDLLERHWKHDTIDLLSIDVEGKDEAILRAFDWKRHRPRVLVFELHDVAATDLASAPLVRFLSDLGYECVGRCLLSVIMKSVR
jgi:FkbM family methyltransferase